MRALRSVARALAASAVLLHPSAEAQGLELSGSVKSLALRSREATGEAFGLSLNRLRVEAKGALAPGLALDLQYDNELLVGSYLRTAEFRATKDLQPPQYWRADGNPVERGAVYGRHRLYRATVTATTGAVDLKLGRQRIAWGTGRFWSPLDILNPASPLALEREERLGVDAVLVEAKLGPLSRLSMVYAPAPDRGAPSRASRWHGNASEIDVSVVAGRLLGLDVVGADIAGQIGQAGVRAEVARLRAPGAAAFTRAMAGVDYAFANGRTLSAELYYNGAGSRDPARYDFIALRFGRVSTLATRYAGLSASYDITPLLKAVAHGVANLDDRSRGADVRLVWSWRPNVDISLGLQRFGGTAASEYGRLPGLTFAQAQWFF